MSLFDIDTDRFIKQKEPSRHPWDHRIDGTYSSSYKHAHNSTENPVYPKTPVTHDKHKVKFTVIGNRVRQEFIYCLYLVKGLHRYRAREYEAPTIQGVTSVDWPVVWDILKLRFGGIAYCLSSQVAVLKDDEIFGGDKELKEYVESRYDYSLNLNYYEEGIQQFHNYINSCGRPCAYFHISVADKPIGCLIFMLYDDIAPATCLNFLRLCGAKKGGYAGTPVHRIVKDCWIQCGGFGLEDNSKLDCENFIIPHDRRGVLCMTNTERHVDCSTQFFVLLQPAPWMENKYVAFGQLIEGESTLSKIESVPTWYESPTTEIKIYKTGVLNLDCKWAPINKNTAEYVHGHVEDLLALGELLYEALLENTFLKADIREQERAEQLSLGEQHEETELVTHDLHVTARFEMTKTEIDKNLAKLQRDEKSKKSMVVTSNMDNENQEFDVEEYEYEFEAYSYQKATPCPSLIVKPEKPFYLPLTDVLYPGEVDSTFDIHKRLRGDYCYENDLDPHAPKRKNRRHRKSARRPSIPEDVLRTLFPIFDEDEEESDDSDKSLSETEYDEIREYLDNNMDKTSFAGPTVKKMAHKRDGFMVFYEHEDEKKKDFLTDEELRMKRRAEKEYKIMLQKKKQVSIDVTSVINVNPNKIKRRQTGFIRKEDVDKIIKESMSKLEHDHDDDDFDRKVRIGRKSLVEQKSVMKSHFNMAQGRRESVLVRLLSEAMPHLDSSDDEGPTLKDLMSTSDNQNTYVILTTSTHDKLKQSQEEKHVFHAASDGSVQRTLTIQHGQKVSRKISSDYVHTIDTIQEKAGTSVRSLEFRKRRPTISVDEYRAKNVNIQEPGKGISASKMATSTILSNKGSSVMQT